MTIHEMDALGNLGNISNNLLINISIKEGVVENIQNGVDYTLEEISSFTYLFKEFHLSSSMRSRVMWIPSPSDKGFNHLTLKRQLPQEKN